MLRRTAILLSATLRAQSSSPLACDAQPALLAMLHGAQSLPSDVLSPSCGSLSGRAAYLGPTTSSRAYHPSLASTSAADAKPGAQAGSEETISLTFIDKENQPHTVRAPLGKHLLEVAHDNEIDLEGACEASLACSTCHVIVENEEYFKRLPEASEDELDMLDLAFGLTDTSRLGCQVITSKDIDGMVVRIPAASRNFYVDGHKPKPH